MAHMTCSVSQLTPTAPDCSNNPGRPYPILSLTMLYLLLPCAYCEASVSRKHTEEAPLLRLPSHAWGCPKFLIKTKTKFVSTRNALSRKDIRHWVLGLVCLRSAGFSQPVISV